MTLEESKRMLEGIVGACGCGDGPRICAYDQAVRVLLEAVAVERSAHERTKRGLEEAKRTARLAVKAHDIGEEQRVKSLIRAEKSEAACTRKNKALEAIKAQCYDTSPCPQGLLQGKLLKMAQQGLGAGKVASK